jgi:hypothetical protein
MNDLELIARALAAQATIASKCEDFRRARHSRSVVGQAEPDSVHGASLTSGRGGKREKAAACAATLALRRASLLTATTRLVSPIAIMVMIVAAMIVIVAVVVITPMYTPMYTPMMSIVGLRLVHGQ